MTEASLADVSTKTRVPADSHDPPRLATRKLRAFPDVAKIATIVAVVTVHVAAPPNEGFDLLSRSTWLATTGLEVAMRWCVPLFVMVSGMLLLGSRTAESPPGEFYRRRAGRVAVPLIGWTVFYVAFAMHTESHSSLADHLELVWLGQPYYHLYFVYIIAGLYVVCPLLARAIASLTERQLAITTIGALVLGSLWSGAEPWLPASGGNAFSEFAPFVGYFLAGYWLGRLKLDRRVVPVAIAVFLAVAILSTIGTYLLVLARGVEDGHYLYSYLSPPVILMSICVFLVFRELTERREARAPIRHISGLHYVGEATFGVFLIHPFFFTLWQERPPGVPHNGASLALWLPATVAGLIAISFACTVMLKQIPFLRRLV